jgi:steroid 5-alpha reductase family enzyme
MLVYVRSPYGTRVGSAGGKLMLRLLLIQAVVMTVSAGAFFSVAQYRKRNDLADVVWGIGFVIASIVAVFNAAAITPRTLVVFGLVVLWGVRLAIHIGMRNARKEEDPRYRKWRQEWGRHATIRSFVQVFLFQGYLVLLVLVPVTYIIQRGGGGNLRLLDWVGIAVWVVGFIFEAVGDYQLQRFKGDPANKGKIMNRGLWRYSRHPNYFGEVTLWWGVYLIALSVPGGWLTIIGPATITFLILGVSGIPLLEKHYEGRAEFQEYKRRTSAFFPMPPKP